MKKTVIFSMVLALALNGCGDKKSNDNSSNRTDNSTNTTNTGSIKHPYAFGYSCEGGDTVNGFTLPPCPDQELNDSTLLGIDTNDNGVRDDVERWIIVKYKNHHKIVTEIGFQTARASQIVIQDPSRAKETTKIMEAAQDCNSYFRNYADGFNDPILIDHSIITSTAFKTMQFNTEQRIRAYLDYNRALSGGVYRLTPISKSRSQCDFNVDNLLSK
jgi:hypothetical protein